MKPWHDTHLSPSERAHALCDTMSREEKIHQLGSFWERSDGEAPAPEPRPDTTPGEREAEREAIHEVAPMENAFAQESLSWEDASALGLGQLTRIFGTEPVSVAEGVATLIARQREVQERSPQGIPALAHEECLTGFTALGATVYPAAIAWGATWNPELIEDMATAIGEDLKAVGIHQGLSPLLDVVRDYRWGRVEETCGEDPYLVGTLGTAYVRGLQKAGIIATLKHFVAYPASRAGRNHAPVSMGRRELEDVMLPPFEMAVREGGVHSVMNSYSDIDGEPAGASRFLLTEVLRERWGFEGTVVSDYWAVTFLQKMHRIAASPAHAAALALRAGLDVELPETTCFHLIGEALEEGLLTEDELNQAVVRILTHKAQQGLLDEGWSPEEHADPTRDLDSPGNRAIARKMAEESIVLLSNDGILPLTPSTRLSVIGPTWGEARAFMGCYSFPNHVLAKHPDHGLGLPIPTLQEALNSALSTAPAYVQGVGFMDGPDVDISAGIAQAVDTARNSDVALLTVGDIAGMFGGGTSGEGCDVVDLSLPGRQGELIEAVLATGTPTILLLVTGRPYAVGAYADRCAAIIQAFMPGVEGGAALADVLTGAVNPSGRLPIALPDGKGGQPGTYLAPPLAWESEGISNLDPRPRFPFGAGISYTNFTLSDPQLSESEISVDGEVTYSVTVTNTGERDGHTVIQLYYEDPIAEVVRPLKQLIGYHKIALAAGQSARLNFAVSADFFSFTGRDYQRIVEPGEILLSAGHSSEERLPGLILHLTGQRRIVAEGRRMICRVEVEKDSLPTKTTQVGE